MWWKSLSHTDGTWGLHHPDGFRPIRVGGKPLSEFPLGWRPRGLFDGPGEFCLVDLSHDSGNSTFWILDRDLCFLFNSSNHENAKIPDAFRTSVSETLYLVLHAILFEEAPKNDPLVAGFFTLQESVRRNLIKLTSGLDLPGFELIDLDSTARNQWQTHDRSGRSIEIPRAKLLEIMHKRPGMFFVRA